MGKKNKNKNNRIVVIDNSKLKEIELDESLQNSLGSHDENNLPALPSKKRQTKIKDEKTKVTRILSKKHRKRLEKVIERKNKKEKRASLLEALSKVHAVPEELNHLTSIIDIQTKGLRRFYQEEERPEKVKPKCTVDVAPGKKINIIRGSKRQHLVPAKPKVKNNDPNYVCFDSSSSGSEDSSDEENEEVAKKIKLDTDNVNIPVENHESLEENKLNDVLIIENEKQVIEIKEQDTVLKIKEQEPVSEKTEIKKECKPAVYVDVFRSEEIQEARLKLPILAEEQPIMEAINKNSVVLIAGETGSGKTTQVPQFLYEAGYAIDKQIAVTEPRRVAATAMSKRVAKEMNLTSREVSYLIRFEGNVTEDTKIKFMTDGVLLKEVQKDFMLTKYSVVILDEAHERSANTDVLIGMLSRIVKQRDKKGNPLKLIIMSATLRLGDFTSNEKLFKDPPVIKVEARQFTVKTHYNKRTNEDYMTEALKKIERIHTELPAGGILVFVTGQQEVNYLVRKLRKAFPLNKEVKNDKINARGKNEVASDDSEIEAKLDKAVAKAKRKKKIKVIPNIDLDDYSVPEEKDDVLSGGESELSDADDDYVITERPNSEPLWVLPLYSLLPSHEQAKVFRSPPEGCRLCVVSTNVAETSLTIPNIKYVVDTGKTKVKLYDKITGVSKYVVTWTSKASAEQRKGRAGRLGPGHCYRLYSSAVFHDTFQEHSVPEIREKPIDDLYLMLKGIHIKNVINFPFPTAPDLLQLETAETRLSILGAIKDKKITPLGKALLKYPVLPRFAKMLLLSCQNDLMPYTICLVAALSVPEVLVEVPVSVDEDRSSQQHQQQQWTSFRQKWAGKGNSLLLGDNMILLKAVGVAEFAHSKGQQEFENVCKDYGLRQKAVIEIRKLRIQLTNVIRANIPDCEVTVDPRLQPPTDLQCLLLRQALLSGMGDQIAKRFDPDEIPQGEKAKYKYAYHTDIMEQPVFLHKGSVLRKYLPEFVIYTELYETQNNTIFMRGVTAIEPEWLPKRVEALCKMSEPLTEPQPKYNPHDGKVYCTVTGTFGKRSWPLPKVEIEHPLNVDYYKWFGSFLLSGIIFNKLEKYVTFLRNQPSTMVKSWGRIQPRVEKLLTALSCNEIKSKEDLERRWQQTPQFLLNEYLDWVKLEEHASVRLIWPPL